MDTEKAKDIIKYRLESLGIEIDESQTVSFDLLFEMVVLEVKNFCNIKELKEGMEIALSYLFLSHYLRELHAKKYLSNEETQKIVKSISEGDISISYNTEDLDEVFSKCYESLKSRALNSLVKFRRISW